MKRLLLVAMCIAIAAGQASGQNVEPEQSDEPLDVLTRVIKAYANLLSGRENTEIDMQGSTDWYRHYFIEYSPLKLDFDMSPPEILSYTRAAKDVRLSTLMCPYAPGISYTCQLDAAVIRGSASTTTKSRQWNIGGTSKHTFMYGVEFLGTGGKMGATAQFSFAWTTNTCDSAYTTLPRRYWSLQVRGYSLLVSTAALKHSFAAIGIVSSSSSSSGDESSLTIRMALSLWRPVAMSTLAGSATTIGGLVVYVLPTHPSQRVLALALSFAAGVMCCVSVLDLWLPQARTSMHAAIWATVSVFAGALGTRLLGKIPLPDPESMALPWQQRGTPTAPVAGSAAAAQSDGDGGAFSSTVVTGAVAPVLKRGSAAGGAGARRVGAVPGWCSESGEEDGAPSSSSSGGAGAGGSEVVAAPDSPAGAGDGHGDGHRGELMGRPAAHSRRAALRLGLLQFCILTLHNLPEGLAVGLSSVKAPELGAVLCAAIALHNLAEGLSLSIPLLAGTGDRRLALLLTAASGLSEPIGAFLGVGLLLLLAPAPVATVAPGGAVADGEAAPLVAPQLLALLDALLCAVGGVMLYVSGSELIPEARKAADTRTVTFGFVTGAVGIGLTLLFL